MERFEMYQKVNGKYMFMGWYPINTLYEDKVTKTKERVINGRRHLYKTYLWNNGDIEEVKYILDLEEV